MEQKDTLDLFKSFINQTIDDIELTQNDDETLIKITFKSKETIVIIGYDMDMYVGLPKEANFH